MDQRSSLSKSPKGKRSQGVRIIGGVWRGRRLPVPELEGLRPTGDRVRETLFNWLQTSLKDAVVADLFAGSGALGIEAASRGAISVTLVEQSRMACESIKSSLTNLGAKQVTLIKTDALAWLTGNVPKLDVVFIDPPFGSELEGKALQALKSGNCMKNNGLVYIETNRGSPPLPLATDWSVQKEKTIGEVKMTLLKRN